MAKYDTVAEIDYVLQYVNQTQLAWVGHSEGTTQMFGMPTVRPDMNSKIALFGALAPVGMIYLIITIIYARHTSYTYNLTHMHIVDIAIKLHV